MRTFIAVVLVALPLLALSRTAADVRVTDAWIAAPIGERAVTAGFLTLRNEGQDSALVSASCNVVKKLELHEMVIADGMMRMRMIPRIALPSKKAVRLHPGGLHLMLIGLTRRLAEGDVLTIRLTFADGSTRDVQVPVRKRNAS